MTPKSFCKPRPDGPFENTLQHSKPHYVQTGPWAPKASQYTGFHTPCVLTKWCLRTDISIAIFPTLLGRLFS